MDGAGALRAFGRAAITGRWADTDEEGNYYFSNPPGITRISRAGQESVLYNFSTDGSSRFFDGLPATIAASRDGSYIFLVDRRALWRLPGPTIINLPDAALAQRIFHTSNGIAFIDACRQRVYLDSNLLAGPREPGKRIDGEPSLDGRLQILSDITGDNAGKLYVADSNLRVVYRLEAGKIERVAGAEAGVQAEIGIPARDANFLSIDSIAVDSPSFAVGGCGCG